MTRGVLNALSGAPAAFLLIVAYLVKPAFGCSLVNVAAGDLLNRDGQAVALIHRDDGPGNLTVVASRPPGAAGVSGSGSICVLTFQAKAAGTTSLSMTRAGAVDSKQQPIAITPAQANVVIH